MSDKTSFTKDEWALLLRSPMNAGMAITAAEPSGLWGLPKESFAGSAELAHAATDPNANPLIRAVVADFIQAKAGPWPVMGSRQNLPTASRLRSRVRRSHHCARLRPFLLRKLRVMLQLSRAGCVKSAKRQLRPHQRAAACLAEVFRSAMPRRRRLAKSPARLASNF